MKRSKPRIIVTGPMGSGKSSLCAALGERLSLPVLPEDMTAMVSFVDRIHSLRQRFPPASQREMTMLNNAWMKAHIDWVLSRKRHYAKLEGFVADRWEADILSFWLVIFGQYYPDVQTLLIFDQMKETAKSIDLIVRLPPASFAFEPTNDAGLKRRAQLSIQLLYDSYRDGLMNHCKDLKIVDIPDGLSIEDRCSFILDQV